MIASTALSIGGPSPEVADNTTAVVVHRSDSNLPATPDISRPAGVSFSALLPLSEETDILVDETHAVKRRRHYRTVAPGAFSSLSDSCTYT